MKYIVILFPLFFLISCQDSNSPEQTKTQTQETINTSPALQPPEPEFISVYKADGAKQCESFSVDVKVMEKELTTTGIDVLCSQKGREKSNRANTCGTATGAINVYRINKANLVDAQLLGFKQLTVNKGSVAKTCNATITPQLIEYEKVYKDYSYKQCSGTRVPPEKMAQELIVMGIDVSCSQVGSDGKVYPAVCEGPASGRNIFTINKLDVTKAATNGFISVNTLNGYVDIACKPRFEKVYKDYTFTQCSGKKVTPVVMAKELTNVGIDVQCAQVGSNGKVYTAACDTLSGGRNIFSIKKFDVTKAATKGFAPVSQLTNYTDIPCKPSYEKVYKDYAYAQCSGKRTIPNVMAKELTSNGIAVTCSQAGSNGKVSISKCGALSGGRNIFTINQFDVIKAKLKGFQPVSQLSNYTDVACNTVPAK